MATQSHVVSAPRFYIQIDSVPIASFQEMTSLVSEVDVQEYIYCDSINQPGAVNHTKQFGKTKPPEITLKRGFDSDQSLWLWHHQVRINDPQALRDAFLNVVQTKTGATDMNDTEPVMAFHLHNAWPKKLEVTGLKAGDGGVAIASIVLVCDQIDFVPQSAPTA
jgi:phage tail-like protein